MDRLGEQCATHSVGTTNQMFNILIQTLLAAQCSISPPNLWPKDSGEKLSMMGKSFYCDSQCFIILRS